MSGILLDKSGDISENCCSQDHYCILDDENAVFPKTSVILYEKIITPNHLTTTHLNNRIVCLRLILRKTNEEWSMEDDVRPIKTKIYAMLRDCNLEEHQKVLNFLVELKPQDKTDEKLKAKAASTPQEPKQRIDVEIDYLCGKWMHCVSQVAQWTYDMHFKGKRPESYEKVLASTKVCYAAMLPIRLVAVIGPDCIGSISIIKHEHEGRTVPLITFMCVPTKFKNAGVEQQLISQSVKVLKGLGYKEAYIKTDKQFFPQDTVFEPVKGLAGVYFHQIPNRATF